MTLVGGDFTLVQFVVAVLFYAGILATVASTPDLEAMLRDAITDALHGAHLSIQETAYAQGICERLWRQQLAGESHRHISLTKLIKLPFSFWLFFGPSLMAVIYRKRLMEFAQSVNDMKRGA